MHTLGELGCVFGYSSASCEVFDLGQATASIFPVCEVGSEADACFIRQDEGGSPACVVPDTDVYHPQLTSHPGQCASSSTTRSWLPTGLALEENLLLNPVPLVTDLQHGDVHITCYVTFSQRHAERQGPGQGSS